MKKFQPFMAFLLALLLVVSALAPAAAQRRQLVPGGPAMGGSSNCWAVGQSVAARQGGELRNATPVTSGGRQACAIVIFVYKPGEHPRRVEVIVPLN